MRPALLLLAPLAIFAAMIATDRLAGSPGRGYAYVQRVLLPSAETQIGLPRIRGPQDASRPLVVIDPGHGGHDPGAAGDGVVEKLITLRLAQALRNELLAGGGIRVALTREDDRYLLLTERSGIARRLKADLFLSIHADSVENNAEARGASVYVLSERGSTDAAARIAARENRADTINGVSLASTSDAVSAILVDLSQRETQALSDDFARLILRETRGEVRLHDEAVQSAAFVVLKSPDMPSALFESGYVSNAQDAALLSSPEGRAIFAKALATAIRVHFARQARP